MRSRQNSLLKAILSFFVLGPILSWTDSIYIIENSCQSFSRGQSDLSSNSLN